MWNSSNLKEWLPVLFMVMIQFFNVGVLLLVKVVADDGSSMWNILTYRFFLGALLAVPLAIFYEKGKLKELTLKAFIWMFISALVGFTIPGLYYIGLGDTSPGYAINFLQHHTNRDIHPRSSLQEGATEHFEPGGEHQGDWNPGLCWGNADH
ncbi:hypothetical protein BRADI_4g14111v3 [Brachypodium distachyon]|uniref:Uncharacterized protein n=1 Tax=Brachypodium distachyon TaxID=15368 RepID=A0A0Q3ENQ2_BRADI|nr:hypothetical protein BRADI_4g14111v3 [Brachypodium distachyon]PNT63318.1 hypothetical protein BRADI_4g14111v3 [Brachypodium distachyon]